MTDYPQPPETPRTYAREAAHRENVLQDRIIDSLVAHEGYERRDATTDFDRALAMDKALLVRFLKDTQPDEWAKLEAHYKTSAEATLFTQLERLLKSRGTLDALRRGLKIVPGIKFALCYFRPASGIEPKRVAEYEANILSVMDEVAYSAKPKNANRLDIVLFVNGLPIATMEAKNIATGSTFRHAEKQYRTDRAPAGEPLLTFKRGALVHLALDGDTVSMTTRLQNGRTRFLPFNRGRNGGAGNPDVEVDFRVAYLYRAGEWGEAIFSRAVLLDVIGRFMHLEDTGKNARMIFPRFQQLDAVRRMMADARDHGAGRAYLVQHSAGSGKSNTIGWLAHHAITLHDAKNRPIFNTAIIVTDRIVLDRQLQGTVAQFEQTAGVVKKIDGTSRQLKEAITKGARIIVTTIQKFSTEHLTAISGQGSRNFAVIVDEAHTSQSGKAAQAMTDALTREANSSEDIEDIIAAYQNARGPQRNISFFAFTATPRNVTLERFGRTGADDLPHPFHLYSMRQAIEEGFILDVLRNYMTYKAYYQLEKVIEDDPELSGRRGQRRVARYATLHPTAIGQKAEIIVEHFRRHVMGLLDGQARAMIVTGSRDHALRYFFGVRDYIRTKGYNQLNALVAFSGELTFEGEVYTEAELNGFSETELPARFDGERPGGSPHPEQYQILIVAEKYQTGFDQPKLCAMYVDRGLAGLQAVQTLSRLNRTAPNKDQTFILDFQNTIEDIQNAFRPYYEVTELEANSDPNLVYHLRDRVFDFGYVAPDEIDRFAETFFKGRLGSADRSRLEGLVREAVGRFTTDDDEGRREEFRQTLKSYMRFYSFVSQVIVLDDTDLEKLYAYASWLDRLLPNREVPPEIEITDDMLRLHAFTVTKKESGNASLSPGDRAPVKAISDFGASTYTDDERRELSEIVRAFNDRHGTSFTEEQIIRLEAVNPDILDDDMRDMLRNNAPDVAYGAYDQAAFQGMIRLFQHDKAMRDIILADPEVREKVTRHLFNRALRSVQVA